MLGWRTSGNFIATVEVFGRDGRTTVLHQDQESQPIGGTDRAHENLVRQLARVLNVAEKDVGIKAG